MLSYGVILDVPFQLVVFVSELLAGHRRVTGTRTGTRALTCWEQGVFTIAWFGDRPDIRRLGAGFGQPGIWVVVATLQPVGQRRCCAVGECCHTILSARSRADARDTLRAALTCAVEEVAARDRLEGLGGTLPGRIRSSVQHLETLLSNPGVEVRLHAVPLYNAIYRFDDQMLVTPYLYRLHGYQHPLLHLKRLGPASVFHRDWRHAGREMP